MAEIAEVRPLHRSYASSDWKDGPLHPCKQTSTGGRKFPGATVRDRR